MAMNYMVRAVSIALSVAVILGCGGGSGGLSLVDGSTQAESTSIEENLPVEDLIRHVGFPDSDNIDNDPATAPTEQWDATTGCVASSGLKVSVLLVGNSLMNDVQSNLEQLLSCGGYTAELATSNPGGYWLHQHIDNPRTTQLIAKGYDLTLVQEQSRSIATHTSPYNVINTLKERIEAAGSQMGFYQTWGYQNRDLSLTDEILSGYENLATVFDSPIVHIGRAWDHFYIRHNESPPFSLHRDYAHATPHGKALVAYVLFAYLTGDSPINLHNLSLPAEEALELQSIAWHTYQAYQ